MRKRILVVDRDFHFIDFVTVVLKPLDWEVLSSATSTAAVGLLDRLDELPCAVFAALRQPHLNGMELAECIRQRHPAMPCILFYEGDKDLVPFTAPMLQSKDISVSELQSLTDRLQTLHVQTLGALAFP